MQILLLLIAIFCCSTKAITFDCWYTNLNFNNIGETYSCYWPSLNNINETRELTNVFGSHWSGKSNDDVRGLYVAGSPSLTYIPRKIEIFFPNLNALYFHNNNISNLSGDELNSFGNLFQFGIQFNKALERLPAQLFANNRNLRGIFFGYNNIKRVGDGLLNGLQELTDALFGNNYCVNQDVEGSSEQIPALIQHFRTNCTDVETCGDINQVVCNIQAQNMILLEKNTNLEMKIQNLEAKIDFLVTKVENLIAKN